MSTEEPLEKTIESQENKNEEIEEKVLSKINKTLLLFISSLNLLIMEVKS